MEGGKDWGRDREKRRGRKKEKRKARKANKYLSVIKGSGHKRVQELCTKNKNKKKKVRTFLGLTLMDNNRKVVFKGKKKTYQQRIHLTTQPVL